MENIHPCQCYVNVIYLKYICILFIIKSWKEQDEYINYLEDKIQTLNKVSSSISSNLELNNKDIPRKDFLSRIKIYSKELK